MTKKDLESGMIVELRNKQLGLLIQSHFGMLIQFESTYSTLDAYKDDLLSANDEELDILFVRVMDEEYQVIRKELNETLVIWERK